MGVLHIIDTLGRGGAEQVLVTLLPELKRTGEHVGVAVLRPPLTLKPDLEKHGIEVFSLPPAQKWNLPRQIGRIERLCQERSYDIVHAHLYFPGLYASAMGMRKTALAFETFHNLSYGGANRAGPKMLAKKWLRGAMARRGLTRCYGVSQAVAEHYREALGLAKVDILPNAVDIAAVNQALDSSVSAVSSAAPLRIVIPGRIVKEKGHADLFSALSGADLPAYRLECLGGGPLENKLKQTSHDLGLPVDFSGPLSHAELLKRMAGADLVVVPSRFEGFGLTAAEAMAMARPVIASDAGGLPEVTGDVALTYPAGDIKALRSALEKLLSGAEQRHNLAEAGYDRVRQRFSPVTIAERLAADYESARRTRTNG